MVYRNDQLMKQMHMKQAAEIGQALPEPVDPQRLFSGAQELDASITVLAERLEAVLRMLFVQPQLNAPGGQKIPETPACLEASLASAHHRMGQVHGLLDIIQSKL